MPEKITLGFDPGLGGAFAVVTGKTLVCVSDMPTAKVKVGKKQRRRLLESSLVENIRIALQNPFLPEGEVTAYVEEVHAMPKQGVSSCFSFGQTYGTILGVLAALGIPTKLVTPQAWQKALRVPKGKQGARIVAAREFPFNSKEFARNKDDGRADAALIALYGSTRS